MYLKVCKNHPDAKLPVRSNPSDAGADVFYCGEDIILLSPGQSHLFDTGLSIEIPHGYVIQVLNRSSMAAKKGIIVGACVIDSGYSNSIFIDLHFIGSRGNEFVRIEPGDKIAQLVCYPIVQWDPIEVENTELYKNPKTISNRGMGGFGSTGG